ncbi:MAG TPA: DNRLRE domain-containing protein [bacterium]|nr:DNRLRE domain-containing protein [bacterium]
MSTTRAYRILALATGLALVALLCSCAITSSDLSGSLIGRVLDFGTGFPIAGAVVECQGEISVSAADGSYSIAGIPTGDRVVSASAPGYDDYSEVVNVGESTLHDIHMQVDLGTARLYGYVSHSVLGVLEGATVSIGDLEVVTDPSGFYEYPDLEQTTYFMTVTKDSFRTHSRSVHPTSEDYRLDVELMKLGQAVIPADADATVLSGAPEENFGDEPDLYLHNDQIHHKRFLIRFDWGALEPTAQAVSAILRLYDTQDLGDEDPRITTVAMPLWSWSEMGVTWVNSPQTTGASGVTATFGDHWYEIEVTSYFAEWLSGQSDNHGILVDSEVDYLTPEFIFASREYAEVDKRPHVILEYAW